jgi:hypothetical protein
MLSDCDLLEEIWAVNKHGQRVYPYRGRRGPKKGLYSANLTNDNKNFLAYTEDELIKAITSGKFKDRGTIRMRPDSTTSSPAPNAFAPIYYKNQRVKDFG